MNINDNLYQYFLQYLTHIFAQNIIIIHCQLVLTIDLVFQYQNKGHGRNCKHFAFVITASTKEFSVRLILLPIAIINSHVLWKGKAKRSVQNIWDHVFVQIAGAVYSRHIDEVLLTEDSHISTDRHHSIMFNPTFKGDFIQTPPTAILII